MAHSARGAHIHRVARGLPWVPREVINMAKAAKQQDTTEKPDLKQNEGEGSRTAARRYNQGVEETVRSGHVDEKAEEAKKALEGPEGEELREAEQAAKEPATPAAVREQQEEGEEPSSWLKKVS
jgi:hypothetical protein